MDRDYNLSHLHLGQAQQEKFISPRTAPTTLNLPNRQRELHANKLKSELENLKKKINTEKNLSTITLVGKEGYDLKPAKDKKSGLEVLVTGRTKRNEPYAVLRMPLKGFDVLEKKFEQYQYEVTKKGNPKNSDLVTGIETIREALLYELWLGDDSYWPEDRLLIKWWELWLDGGNFDRQNAKEIRERMFAATQKINIHFEMNKFIEFSERQVILVQANIEQLEGLITETDVITEIHQPSRVSLQIFSKKGHVVSDVLQLSNKIISPDPNAIKIAIIDTGVTDQHPLLKKLFLDNSLFTIDMRTTSTGDYTGHGTLVAGIAGFGDLTELLNDNSELYMTHSLESVRFQVDSDGSKQELWGSVTESAVTTVETNSPTSNRIFNLSVGAQYETPLNGKPTSWSAAVDSICFNDGNGRLMTIAAGNIYPIDQEGYINRNLISQIDDPSHSLNSICVGGITHLTDSSPIIDYAGEYIILAKSGELSPHSRTGPTKFAIKPDVVWEAGNVMVNSPLWEDSHDGLSLLTTNKEYMSDLLTNTCQTSMAAPGVARLLALIWSENPLYTAATIRGLLIHSASWTQSMRRQVSNKSDMLRAFGYGMPDVNFARNCAKSAVTLVSEDEIQCGYVDGESDSKKTIRDLNFYKIPWPKEVLMELSQSKVELRVTLSFFIEPNPRYTASSYEGASLAWDIQGPTETDEDFFKRVNKARREDDEKGFTSEIDWDIGPQARSRGTVQSDRWSCTAAELSGSEYIVVFPRHGWWKDNNKKRPNPKINYSLIISVISEDTDIDLYIPIKEMISVLID